MKRKYRRIPIILLIMGAFLIPVLDAYFDYYILMEADFLSAAPKVENTDLECLLVCEKQKLTAISGFSYTFWLASNLIEHFSCFYYQVMLPQVTNLVLRC